MPYQNMAASIARPAAGSCHALLFVGVCNVERYVRSLLRWTHLLHDTYGYPLANIRIVAGPYGDPSWPLMEPGADVTYNATRTDLDDALAAYGAGGSHALGLNDSLFIFTFNHGGNDSDGLGSYLCCENFATKYYASDFATRVAAIQCRQTVLLAAQCHAGGFVDPFIDALPAATRGAVMAGCRSDQVTYEAICDKLFASAFNGRMVQNALDDNIDLGITGTGMGVYTVPGYHTDRIDWGPTGAISAREAFNWVYDHYITGVRPAYSYVTEVPLYRQKPWMEAGQPVHIRLGEPDLVMQDCGTDTGAEPSTCAHPWHSPDLYADNTDQFPGIGPHEYVPAHDNRFFARTANRGTAPTDDVWRLLEVRGLGFTGGPVGPPRIDRAIETVSGVTASARLRPGRAHTQFERILIGGDFGHGCVSAAAWCGADPMSHALWSIKPDNDQAQCNLSPAAVSGAVPVSAGSTNSNAGKIVRVIPVTADEEGAFDLQAARPEAELPFDLTLPKRRLALKKGATGEFTVEITLKAGAKPGVDYPLTLALRRNREVIGGVTFLLRIATASVLVALIDHRNMPVVGAKVILWQPGDPRKLTAAADRKGVARFGPLNPGFYFAHTRGSDQPPVRVWAAPDREARLQLIVDTSGRRLFLAEGETDLRIPEVET